MKKMKRGTREEMIGTETKKINLTAIGQSVSIYYI